MHAAVVPASSEAGTTARLAGGRDRERMSGAAFPGERPTSAAHQCEAGGAVEGPRLRAVVFDLDGTLANTLGLNISSFQQAFLRTTGRRFSAREICDLCGASQEGMAKSVAGDRWRERLAGFYEFFEAHFDEQATPYAGIDELLAFVDGSGLETAIVTGAGRRCVELTLRRLGLAARIRRVEIGSERGPRKPQQLTLLATAWGIAPARVAYVGDFPADMIAAGAAGVQALGAAWDPGADAAALRDAGAAAVFASPLELRAWLEPRGE